jgi:NAD(P)-dependent dehydrogenase (short-subunit alcohol dehydrogenase family)
MTDFNPYNLSGKTILVTGASSGIGKATAINASKLGATVIITARNKDRLKETFDSLDRSESSAHKMILADLTVENDMKNLLAEVPTLDGLVLCAGKGLTLPLQFASREKFDDIFDINFFAPVELLRMLFKKKILRKYASVVMLASIDGTQTYGRGNSIYGASKSALNAFMRFAAKELAGRRIRVNSICPAMVETPLIHGGIISEAQLLEDEKRYPLGRYGKPEDIAYAVIYLLSDAASWITGQSLVLDGGSSIK